jgi:hypothetical protein
MLRWVVLERADPALNGTGASLLKCLQCGFRWKSKRLYVGKLRDWKEEHRSGMTDQDILDRLLDGTLRVDLETAWVFSCSGRFTGKATDTWRELTPIYRQPEDRQCGYWFMEITRNGKKKKIARHRIVWMAANLQLVPDDCDVDHKRYGDGDGIDNLQLLTKVENRGKHNGRPWNRPAGDYSAEEFMDNLNWSSE